MTGQGNRVGPLLRGSLVPFSHNTPTLSEPVEAVDRSANRRESADASSRTQWTHSPARTRVKKSIDLLESWTQGWCWAVARRATTDVPQQWGPGRMRAPDPVMSPKRELIDCAFDVGRDASGGGRAKGTDGCDCEKRKPQRYVL
ncbi:hypothetical protein M419DRAFT_83626 [Trichoderma reesei RUT C-30]|uniref:Uncharacterized protein n=1 Tax=Hypocrea jecorina (strain ATCC 56765 / BCRC 32924 / NRRL 11460 / Rut C-30) TaxID=1344414 RepID=A0A024S633_HYPJR|nr:hypothetical protein M419DRAFT_83626 [Trichoderma reesei RUT C-30]